MRAATEGILELLRSGEMELLGLLPDASNYTFVAAVTAGDERVLAVYKPRAGETPLWDFPDGTLWAREVAAFEVSEALGWGLVPPTVAREGPHGPGSVQLYVEADPEHHYLTLMPAHAGVFRQVAAFDVVVNNADRKSGHCLLDGAGRIWVVDHGVCFNAEDKLRTVIWEFAGEPLPPGVGATLRRLGTDLQAGPLRDRLDALLAPAEVEAARARTALLVEDGRYPQPQEGRRHYPWPPV